MILQRSGPARMASQKDTGKYAQKSLSVKKESRSKLKEWGAWRGPSEATGLRVVENPQGRLP